MKAAETLENRGTHWAAGWGLVGSFFLIFGVVVPFWFLLWLGEIMGLVVWGLGLGVGSSLFARVPFLLWCVDSFFLCRYRFCTALFEGGPLLVGWSARKNKGNAKPMAPP